MSMNRVRCFFDVEVDGVPLGRVIFELFNDVCPKTCENFRALCTGEMGHGPTTGKPLHYRSVKFHRVIKDFMVQAGDFSSGNGTGGESIYGGQFEDENFDINHDAPFLLSMANRGPNTNGSQFFLTTQTASHLDGKHVVFGRVLNGQEVVVSIENLDVDNRSRPLQQAVIANCGELIMQLSGQMKTKEKKKKKKKVEEDIDAEDDKKKKKKKKEKKHKHKKDKQSDSEEEPNADTNADADPAVVTVTKDLEMASVISAPPALYKLHPLAAVSTINPDEIPEVPKNRFLDRGFQNRRAEAKEEEEEEEEVQKSGRMKSKANVRFFTKSGRKVKGRGLLRYRTPSRSRSRSRSATPPHWRQAQRRTVTYEKYQRQTEEMETREREIEERRKRREERHRLQCPPEEREDGGEDGGGGGGGGWKPPPRGEAKLGSVIHGRMRQMGGEGGGGEQECPPSFEEDKMERDWRVARHETLVEDKENRDRDRMAEGVNRKDVKDLRQKLKGRIAAQSFTKGHADKRNRRDEDAFDLDDTALDYEAPSENEEEEEEEEAVEGGNAKDEEREAKQSARGGAWAARERGGTYDRVRERGRNDGRFRGRPMWGEGRSSRGGRPMERNAARGRDRRDSERRESGSSRRERERRRETRERRNGDKGRDRERSRVSGGKQRERGSAAKATTRRRRSSSSSSSASHSSRG